MPKIALRLTSLYRPVAFKSGDSPFPKNAEGKVELGSVDYTETYAVSELKKKRRKKMI